MPVDVKGALQAARDAIRAFFLLWELFEAEARIWWVIVHRAFLEALCMGQILREQSAREEVVGKGEMGLFEGAGRDIGESLSTFHVPFVRVWKWMLLADSWSYSTYD